MKHNIYIIIALISISGLLWPNIVDDQMPNDGHMPNQWMYNQRVFPHNNFPTNYKKSAFDFIQKNNSLIHYRSERQWESVGPSNIGGRITDIELIDNDTNQILIGTASGGIFKSTNGGDSWNPIFDQSNSLSIGDVDIAKDSSTLMYAGTGEPNSGGGSITYDGDGIYKSIDGGVTWENKGLELAGSIAKVAINPIDPNIVFAACMGPLFANDSLRGIYRTKDGGTSWEQVLFVADSAGGIDIIIDPINPDTIYVAFWERIRTWNTVSYGGHASGVYRSTDGGDNWIELKNGLPKQRFEKGRIGLTICEEQPNVLYAYYVKRDGNFRGIFKSIDYGNHWIEMNVPDFRGVNFFWWFGKIFVDPTDPDIVFATGVNMKKSIDGGVTWNSTFEGVHVDHHAILFHPENSNWILNGNDGGLYKSRDGGVTNTKLHGLPISQFYTCEIDEMEPSVYYGGTQDNSTMRGKKDEEWNIIYRGDGFYTLVDPEDNKIMYTEYQYGRLAKSINSGQEFKFSTNGIKGTDRTNWNTPVVFDPNDSKVMYYGSNRLYRTKNKAESWTVISPDLTDGPYNGQRHKGTITSISVSPLNEMVIYVGTDDGKVHYTDDRGQNWNLINNELPDRWVTRVTCDPNDEHAAYVCFSGYRHNDYIAHVYKTNDDGKHWIDISGNLPDVPVNDLIVHSTTDEIFIATDIGVFSSQNEIWEWSLLSNGMPNVVVNDIDLNENNNQLVAATFGRSMYVMDIKKISTVQNDVRIDEIKLNLYPNPVVNQLNIKWKGSFNEMLNISLFTLEGKLIFNKKIMSNRLLDLGVPKGVYMINIMARDRVVHTQKIIKL